MDNVRTDMALEKRELYEKKFKREIDGVIAKEETIDEIKVTTVDIINEDGEKKMGKGIGRYITIDMPSEVHYDADIKAQASHLIASSLEQIIKIKEHDVTLVVGLGNESVTPDALGPKVVKGLMVTRHLKKLIPEHFGDEVRPVCAIAPGVLGTTGIESGEIIKSLVEKIKPAQIICIDALASRKLERVANSIQITDTGIEPGAGVGNNRMKINKENMGVPVIAIGVPTVVDAGTIASDAIDLVIDEMIEHADEGKGFYNMLKNIDRYEKSNMIRNLLNPYVGDLMVTPKEVDDIIDSISKLVSEGLNVALQPDMLLEDINSFLN